MAELLVLDLIGVAAGAATTEASRIAHDTAAMLFAAGAGQPGARMLFDGRPVSMAGAGYANATQIDNLDAHDGYAPAMGHVGVALLPAVLAFGETLGQEVAGRVALHGTVHDYHTSGAWNCLAVAAIGCRLRGLSRETLREALGIAEYHGPRSQMMREIDNPSMLHDGSGWGTLGGITAVLLAEQGFTGKPAITMEGPGATGYWADLGQTWLTEAQYIKPYPICRWAHAPIDAVLKLRREHGLIASDVAAVEINTFHESARLYQGVPHDTARAQYALAYPVAIALVRGKVGPEELTAESFADPEAARLIGATSVSECERHKARFPAGRWADVTLVLKDGRRVESGDIDARGDVSDPLSREEIIAKFHHYTAPLVGEARARAIESAVFALKGGAPLSDLFDLVYAPPA